MAQGFTLFETTVGRCGIAWDDANILAVRLPERDDAATAASLRRRVATSRRADPPPFAAAAIAAIAAHLAGEPADLDALPLDFASVTTFERAVLTACRAIAKGTTRTYGEIAREIGDPQAARAVGAALGRNPWPIVVPCHRVLAAGGKLGGFSAPGGRTSKVRLLEIEGALPYDPAPTLFDAPVKARPGAQNEDRQ